MITGRSIIPETMKFCARQTLLGSNRASISIAERIAAVVCSLFLGTAPESMGAEPSFSAYGRLSQASAGQSYNSSGPNASGGAVGESIPSQSYSASAGGSATNASARAIGSGIWYPSAGASVGGVIRIANPSLLTPFLQPGNSQVQFNLPVSASYNLDSFGTFGIFNQAIGSISFAASASGAQVSGAASSVNGPYEHSFTNSGVFSGFPEKGGSVSVSLAILITPTGNTPVEIPFSVAVDAWALDISGQANALGHIDASFVNSLTDSSGNPINLGDFGIQIIPIPTPIPDYTGDDEHTPKGCGPASPMASYNFHTMLASLIIKDTPVGYDPPYGYSMPFAVTYTQRETTQPSTFTYANLGRKWNINWMSYITDDPANFAAVSRQARPGGGSLPIVFVATDGGYHTYRFVGRPAMQLRRAVADPLPYEILNADGSREIYGQSDGSTAAPRKVFLTQHIDPAGNATTITYDAQIRIAKITDPLGQEMTVSYGLASDPLKITKVTDPFGRFATFEYDASGRLVKITDVIGIQSVFTYEGASDFINSFTTPYGTTTFANTVNGHIHRITATDPAGDTEVVESNDLLTLGIPFSDAGNLVPTGMTITHGGLGLRNSFYWDKKRWREAPNDYTKAHIYHWLLDENSNTMSGYLESEKPPLQNRIWYNYPGQTQPQIAGTNNRPSKIGRVIEGGTQLTRMTYSSNGKLLSRSDPLRRTTTYAYDSASIDLTDVHHDGVRAPLAVNCGSSSVGMFDSDFGFAGGDNFSTSSSIDSAGVANAAPEGVYQTERYGENFTYTFQHLPPSTSCNVRLHFAEIYFDAAGQRIFRVEANNTAVISDLDIFVAAGNRKNRAIVREFTAASDASGILVLRFVSTVNNAKISGIEVIPPASPALSGPVAAFTYNSQHRPLTATDATGQTTNYSWNSVGQVASVKNAKNETTTFSYYSANVTGKQRKARLQTIDGALAGSADSVTFDYDAAGNVAKVTGPDGYFLVFTHDALNRLTRVTFPDGTYTETTYLALDPQRSRDRLGRLTHYVYNSIRQLISVTDPAQRQTRFSYCDCGEMDQLIDAMGRITTWRHDLAGRVTAKIYADGSTIKYAYEPLSGRLSSVTDEKKQVKTRTYNLDNTLAGINYANSEHATPNVAFTYEADLPRLKSMADGIGATDYAYNPIIPGTLGAGQLASVDGPLPNDTVTYTYDELGRRTGYAINGVGETRSFDPLGRLLSAVNPLGTFDYTYVGATNRTDKVTYPNGMTCQYNYHPVTGDFRLKDIIHTLPGNTLLSRHSYEYSAVGNITRWTQISPQAGLNRSWLCGYDNADQLTSVASQDPITLVNQPTGQYAHDYDPAGNRLIETIDGVTTTAHYNALNQLTGLEIRGVSIPPDQTYEWDAEDRLAAINYTGTNGRSEFEYDGYGRRQGVREKQDATVIAYRRFAWRGLQMAEERDPSGAGVQKRYLGRGMQTSEGGGTLTARLFTRDHLGSIRGLVSGTGLTAAYDFDPWGRRSMSVSQSDESSLAFTGHWFHERSGLVLASYRAYSPAQARWLTRDPLSEMHRYKSSGTNLYSYAVNAPTRFVDRLGLEPNTCSSGDPPTPPPPPPPDYDPFDPLDTGPVVALDPTPDPFDYGPGVIRGAGPYPPPEVDPSMYKDWGVDPFVDGNKATDYGRISGGGGSRADWYKAMSPYSLIPVY
jgi:RHS repeat-associated protein